MTRNKSSSSQDASSSASSSSSRRLVPVHTFGFGADHDAAALHAIAADTAGVFSFVEEPAGVTAAFAQCLGGLLSVVIQEAKISFAVGSDLPGWQIAAVHAGGYAYRVGEKERDGAVLLGDLYAEEERHVMLEVWRRRHVEDESRARDTSGAAQRDMCRILRARCSYRCRPLFQDTHRTPLVELAVARAEDQEEEDEEEGEEVEEGWKEEGRMWEEGAEGEWYDEQHGQEEGEYGVHSSGHDSFAAALAAAGGWDSGAQGSSRQVSGRQGGGSHGVSPPVSGAMESGRQGGEGRRRKAEVARERKRKKAPPPLALERQKNRLAATKCITAALQQAEAGSLAAAQRTIQQGVAAIQASYAMQQGDEASMHLIDELMEIERRMCNMQTYKGAGLAYALSAQSAHLLQRANTRGGGAAADSTAGLDYM
ncbi:unnamed protein product, partial [Closterium sp. NIES-53]